MSHTQTSIVNRGNFLRSGPIYLRNAAASVLRIGVISIVALLLPAYLVHRLSVDVYAAWVLILQLGAYVSYLDVGVQTAVAKFVAEHEAGNDLVAASRSASAGFMVISCAAILGCGLSLLLSWQVPFLFRTMPTALYREVRISLVLVGCSLSVLLASAVFAAIFQGLQRYGIPMFLAVLNRVLYALLVAAVVAFHRGLIAMAITVAAVNVLTSLLQFAAWHRFASSIRVTFAELRRTVVVKVLRYCGVLGVWSFTMLIVSGLDLTIVGHYDYGQTAYYSVAVLPTNFLLMIASAVMNPMIPVASALAVRETAASVGQLLYRATRYTVLLLLLMGIPLLAAGHAILRVWVGLEYARHAILYLQILVLANILRNLFLPYATIVVAVGQQKYATYAAVGEAVVNLAASLWLASRMGAVGVALGTLLGAAVTVSIHSLVSLRLTRRSIAIERGRFFGSLFRPALIALPTLAIYASWQMIERHQLGTWFAAVGIISTLLILWFAALDRREREQLWKMAR